MLGKLAKWLRMLGYDTVYIADADDDDLVRLAVREQIICSLATTGCLRGEWSASGVF